MDLRTTKVVVLLLLGLTKIVFGLAPLVLTRMLKKRDRWLKKFIGFILCFGGGVLVSTIFIHMLSEVKETLSQAAEFGAMPEDSEYPFPELIVLMGFLFILLVETVAAKFLGGHGGIPTRTSTRTGPITRAMGTTMGTITTSPMAMVISAMAR